jgi:hypothetical protein
MVLSFLAWISWAAALPPAPQETGPVVVRPEEIRDLLANPGMGWQTFHCFADGDKNLAGLPSGSAYFRFYWSQMEPEEGRIDVAKFDGLLARARKAGQKLAFRVMCAGTDDGYLYVPKWLKDRGCKGFEYQYGGKGPVHWVPDFEDPLFQKAHFRFIEDLGKRYDGHPDLDLVDIGSVGLWGEWHMSSTKVSMPAPETRLKIIEAWVRAFPKSPKAMLIGDTDGVKEAVRRGCGWRADCLGDMGGFSTNWNHMKNLYPVHVEKAGAGEAWKTGPVAFESCWDMRRWKAEKWDIRFIFDYGLDYHASYMNNKSAPIPEGTREEVERFVRRLGYRLVLRKLEHPASAARGSHLALAMSWENIGVAPPYRDHLVGVRLEAEGGKIGNTLAGKTSVKGWLPGVREVREAFAVPADFPPGRAALLVGVLDPATGEPAVRLAVAGRRDDGWYPMGAVQVR